eukprot:282538-Chlamydomonas_euryale.AAC.2
MHVGCGCAMRRRMHVHARVHRTAPHVRACRQRLCHAAAYGCMHACMQPSQRAGMNATTHPYVDIRTLAIAPWHIHAPLCADTPGRKSLGL